VGSMAMDREVLAEIVNPKHQTKIKKEYCIYVCVFVLV
jgi:hypothetical protein